MTHNFPTYWLNPASLDEAKRAQYEMAKNVCTTDMFRTIEYIGGMDVSNTPFDPEEYIFAACVILKKDTGMLVESSCISMRQYFPYIPGFLGFREAPALFEAFQKLQKKPDLLLVDGHGISHPRGLGIASHIGVLLDIPTIGVAKNILIGAPQFPIGHEVGSIAPLIWQNKEVGALLRSRKNAHPLIISSGYKISLPTAIEVIKECLKGYRLPEPTRYAHNEANICRKAFIANKIKQLDK